MNRIQEWLRDHQRLSLAVGVAGLLVAVLALARDYYDVTEDPESRRPSESKAPSAQATLPTLPPTAGSTTTIAEPGSEPSAELTTQPPAPAEAVELTSLPPSSVEWGYDVQPSRMGGTEYPTALKLDATSSEERTIEYALSNQYATLSGWVGLDDNSPNSHAIVAMKLTDERNRVLARADAPVGRPQRLSNVNVKGVIVLRITYIVRDSRPDILINKLPVTIAGAELQS
jgi:hypothetical protein